MPRAVSLEWIAVAWGVWLVARVLLCDYHLRAMARDMEQRDYARREAQRLKHLHECVRHLETYVRTLREFRKRLDARTPGAPDPGERRAP